MALRIRIPKREDIVKRAKTGGYGLVLGGLVSKLKATAPKQSDLYKFARDKLKRPQYAGHVVVIPVSLLGSLVLPEEYEDLADKLAYTAGYEAGDIVRREIDKEPVILLYKDKLHVMRFNGSAELFIFIDGVRYDANSFNTPPSYGSIDTQNNKIYTDANGEFEATFKTTLTEGEHTVCVIDSAGKGYCIRVEL